MRATIVVAIFLIAATASGWSAPATAKIVRYELAGAFIEKYDNASEMARAKFIGLYLVNGQKQLIEMLPENRNSGNRR